MFQSMGNAPKGTPLKPHKFVALIFRRGFEDYLPVTCFWCHEMSPPRWVFGGQKTDEVPLYWADFPTEVIVPMNMVDADRIIREEWQAAVKKYNIQPYSILDTFVRTLLDRIRGIDDEPYGN